MHANVSSILVRLCRTLRLSAGSMRRRKLSPYIPCTLVWSPAESPGTEIAARIQAAEEGGGPDLILWDGSFRASLRLEQRFADKVILLGKPLFRPPANGSSALACLRSELALSNGRTTAIGARICRCRDIGRAPHHDGARPNPHAEKREG